jgi:hypothetical protein
MGQFPVGPSSTPKFKLRMFLTTKYVLPGGRTEKHYHDALSGGRETGLYSLVLSASGHDRPLANILYGPHHRALNGSAFAVKGLQFNEDGKKIALYANTLPGSFFLREEVV